MRFFKASKLWINKANKASVAEDKRRLVMIHRMENIPGGLLPSIARFRLSPRTNFLKRKLYLQPVEKTSHLHVNGTKTSWTN
jgi:hypothetical protein